MKHYTLLAYRPAAEIIERIKEHPKFAQSAPDQWCLWDAPATLRDMRAMFQAVSPFCKGLSLFVSSTGLRKSKQLMNSGSWE